MSDPSAKAVERENVKQPGTALYSINQGQHDMTAPMAMSRDRAREKAIAGRGDRVIVTVTPQRPDNRHRQSYQV